MAGAGVGAQLMIIIDESYIDLVREEVGSEHHKPKCVETSQLAIAGEGANVDIFTRTTLTQGMGDDQRETSQKDGGQGENVGVPVMI